MDGQERVFRVNESTEAVNALKMLIKFLVEKQEDSYNLKWALLSAHNALQAFMVLVLRGTSNLEIIQWKKEYAGKSAEEICLDPRPKMLSFMNLFRKCKRAKHMLNNPFVDRSGTITTNIKNFNFNRTDFVHYLPKAWGIGIDGLLLVIKDTLKVIDFLIDDPRLSVHFDGLQRSELKAMVSTAKTLIVEY